jgi:riboflavin kinase/FMN adenylyltransferase
LKVTWGLENASCDPKTVATLGSYDGMHRGHIEILKRLIKKKEELGLDRSLVLTFDPHPQEILHKNNKGIDLLTTIDERLELLEASGVDETLVIRFSLEFAKTPYNEFFKNILIKAVGTKAMVVGFNHAFGKNREGDTDHLRILASEAGIEIEEVSPLVINGVSVSSTKIRHALSEGNLAVANGYLGRPYELSGIVVEGDKLGRTLGFPTVNLQVPEHKLIPSDGVYAGSAIISGKAFTAAISIGSRPTIKNNDTQKIEAYLLDFDRDIYGERVTLGFFTFIRPQQKFVSLDELKEQMKDDILKVRVVTNNRSPVS